MTQQYQTGLGTSSAIFPRWEGAPRREHEAQIYKEVDDLLEHGLAGPSGLIFHTIELTDKQEGPSICVWGKEGDDAAVYAEYSETTKIVSLKRRI